MSPLIGWRDLNVESPWPSPYIIYTPLTCTTYDISPTNTNRNRHGHLPTYQSTYLPFLTAS